MARKHPLWKFWFWFGANPFWDLLKFVGGTTVVNSLWTVFKAEVHHHPVDWILFGVYALVGFLMTAIAVHYQKAIPKTDVDSIERSGGREEWTAPDYVLNGYSSQEEQNNALVEQSRVLAVGNKLDGAFTMLQIEAISLANFLRRFIDSLDAVVPPRETQGFDDTWDNARTRHIKITTLYERDCAPEVNRFIQRAKIEMGYSSKRLEAYKDHAHDIENIETVRAQLWVFVLRSLQVDFTGEL